MRLAVMVGVVVVFAVLVERPVAGSSTDYKALYEAHRWFELRDAVMKTSNAPPLYCGAVAAAFNDRPRADTILNKLIHSPSAAKDDVYEGYNILAHMLLDAGQYRQFGVIVREKWRVFPDKAGEELKDYGAFLSLPNQKVGAPGRSLVSIKEQTWIPLTINGSHAEYFFDTGAVPAMSESEAKRLGMTILDSDGTTGTSTGQRVGFRIAVAKDLAVGGTKFRDVSFLIFPDDQKPWASLPPGRRGLLGIPVLLGLHRLEWSNDQTLRVGGTSSKHDIPSSNLYFDDDHLVVLAMFQDRPIALTLDTGAETTDLYGKFATEFSSLINQSGKRISQKVEGVSNNAEFEAISVPEVVLRIGSFPAALKPAHVIIKQLGQAWSYGNLGLDVITQADKFVIDFDTMTLQMTHSPANRIKSNLSRSAVR